jgi:hypothetical protein
MRGSSARLCFPGFAAKEVARLWIFPRAAPRATATERRHARRNHNAHLSLPCPARHGWLRLLARSYVQYRNYARRGLYYTEGPAEESEGGRHYCASTSYATGRGRCSPVLQHFCTIILRHLRSLGWTSIGHLVADLLTASSPYLVPLNRTRPGLSCFPAPIPHPNSRS